MNKASIFFQNTFPGIQDTYSGKFSIRRSNLWNSSFDVMRSAPPMYSF